MRFPGGACRGNEPYREEKEEVYGHGFLSHQKREERSATFSALRDSLFSGSRAVNLKEKPELKRSEGD